MGPRVSVVIIVYNGEKTIGRCIDSILNQDDDNYEIIVVNDGSVDDTESICKRYGDKIVYFRSNVNMGVAGARNRGFTLAGGQYIAYTDSDCVAQKDWLSTLVRYAVNNRVDVLGGAVLTPKDLNFFARCVGTLHKPGPILESENIAKDIPTANALFSKSLYREIKGFDETFRVSNEDTDLLIRMQLKGRKIHYEPRAKVYHYHKNNVHSFAKWRFDTGLGLCMLAKKYSFKVNRTYNLFNLALIPFLLLVTLVSLIARPIILPVGVLALFLGQLTRNYIRDRDNFKFGEILGGVLLGWLLRLVTSVGFYYGLLVLPREHKAVHEIVSQEESPGLRNALY